MKNALIKFVFIVLKHDNPIFSRVIMNTIIIVIKGFISQI